MEFAELILTPKLDNVILHHNNLNNLPVEGKETFMSLCLTGHHLILSSRKEDIHELWLLHQNLDGLERRPNIVNNILQGGTIILKYKDLRIISLTITTPQEYINIAQSIEQLSKLEDIYLQYAFFYRPMYNILEDGYTIFRPEVEFSKLLSTDEWRISTVNKDYSVCPTYSSTLIVPKTITDSQLIQSASFRDGGRFPILSYRHENGAILLRSSQPLSGTSIKRCRADEAILDTVLVRSKKGLIIDTWGKSKSKTNTETDQHYSQWRKVTRPLGNFSSVSNLLDSFTKLIEACNDTTCNTDKWLSRLDNSGWLAIVLNALNSACIVAQCLDQENIPVLVHGGKGLDSTLIVTSLVQIILKPDCRTVRGLQALIEREWIQCGHPFATRHKQSCYTPSQSRTKSSSSTFVLFLDCVYQLYCQFPCSFEFSSEFLITIFEHSYFSQYGTFLGDSEKERVDAHVFKKTTSLWSYINRPDILTSYLNPLYEPNNSVIWPSVAPISLVLWSDLYLRWVIEQNHTKRTLYQIQNLISEEKELRTKVIKYRKQLLDLYKELQELQKINEEFSD